MKRTKYTVYKVLQISGDGFRSVCRNAFFPPQLRLYYKQNETTVDHKYGNGIFVFTKPETAKEFAAEMGHDIQVWRCTSTTKPKRRHPLEVRWLFSLLVAKEQRNKSAISCYWRNYYWHNQFSYGDYNRLQSRSYKVSSGHGSGSGIRTSSYLYL